MKRVTPSNVYRGVPCSVVAVGCAMGVTARERIRALYSPSLKPNGYLSLGAMDRLVRANLSVTRRVNYKRGQRPILRDWAHENKGIKAILLVASHFIYFDGRDYHSFFWNGGDIITSVWEVG